MKLYKNKKGQLIITQTGLDLVKHFEGCYLKAYNDRPDDPAHGTWTIGYGRINYADGRKVKPGDTCTQAQADAWLMEDLEDEGAKYVRAYMKNWMFLTDDQFSAMVSFTFNRGAGRFNEQLDDILDEAVQDKVIDWKELAKVKKTVKSYDWAGKKTRKILAGLTRRRTAEARLFAGEDWTVMKKKDWRKYV